MASAVGLFSLKLSPPRSLRRFEPGEDERESTLERHDSTHGGESVAVRGS